MKQACFSLDTTITDEDGFDGGYHLPALYFLSGLTQFPFHLLKSSINLSLHRYTEELEQDILLKNNANSAITDIICGDNFLRGALGTLCTENFLQLYCLNLNPVI